MAIRKKISLTLLIVALIISCFLTCFIPTTMQYVSASSIDVDAGYTDVLEDLQKDENFNESQYFVNMQDYSLKVIHIAESIDNELFVYVYQPCSPNTELKATSVNISTEQDINNPKPRNYGLTLLSSNGVFYKYKVKDFVVKTDSIRYYDIDRKSVV